MWEGMLTPPPPPQVLRLFVRPPYTPPGLIHRLEYQGVSVAGSGSLGSVWCFFKCNRPEVDVVDRWVHFVHWLDLWCRWGLVMGFQGWGGISTFNSTWVSGCDTPDRLLCESASCYRLRCSHVLCGNWGGKRSWLARDIPTRCNAMLLIPCRMRKDGGMRKSCLGFGGGGGHACLIHAW